MSLIVFKIYTGVALARERTLISVYYQCLKMELFKLKFVVDCTGTGANWKCQLCKFVHRSLKNVTKFSQNCGKFKVVIKE